MAKKRKDWNGLISGYKSNELVFLDESGCNTDMTRRYAYCGKFNIHWSVEKSTFVFCSATVILTIWKMIEVKIGTSIGAERYQNPVIIIEAISAFMLFSNFKIQSRIINQLSKGCFTVFIVHSHFIQIFLF